MKDVFRLVLPRKDVILLGLANVKADALNQMVRRTLIIGGQNVVLFETYEPNTDSYVFTGVPYSEVNSNFWTHSQVVNGEYLRDISV